MTARRYENAYLILDEDTTQFLHFQLWPEEISFSKAADWAAVPIIGRAEPYHVFGSSGPGTWSFNLIYVASVEQDDLGELEDVDQALRFLESLVLPDEVNGIVVHPPLVNLVVGTAINRRCKVDNLNVRRMHPWDPVTGQAHRAEVSIVLTEVYRVPPTSSEMRAGTLR